MIDRAASKRTKHSTRFNYRQRQTDAYRPKPEFAISLADVRRCEYEPCSRPLDEAISARVGNSANRERYLRLARFCSSSCRSKANNERNRGMLGGDTR